MYSYSFHRYLLSDAQTGPDKEPGSIAAEFGEEIRIW